MSKFLCLISMVAVVGILVLLNAPTLLSIIFGFGYGYACAEFAAEIKK